MKRIAVAIVALMTIVAYSACQQPKAVEYKDVEHLRIRPLQKDPISVDVKFYNPNSYPLTLKEAAMDIFINDTHIGAMHTTDAYEIPALDTFLLPLSISVDVENALPISPQLLLARYADVKLDGEVKAGRKHFYLTIPVHYQGRQKLDIPKLKLGE